MTRLPRRPRLARPAKALVRGAAALGLCTGLALGCKGGLGGGDSCTSTREYFADQVWNEVMGRKCITCHGPGGVAEAAGAEFNLLPSSYPGFMDANFAEATEASKVSYEDVSALLAKPSGQTKHGGGEVIKQDSEEYRILESLVSQLKDPVECDDDDVAELAGVVVLTPEETLRKARDRQSVV